MDRRLFARGLVAATASIIAAPAIVKAENLMKIASLKNDIFIKFRPIALYKIEVDMSDRKLRMFGETYCLV